MFPAELLAALAVAIFFIVLLLNQKKDPDGFKALLKLSLWVFFVDILDIIRAVAMMYRMEISRGINISMNTILFAIAGLLCVYFVRYTDTLVSEKKSFPFLLSEMVLIVYLLVLLGNYFFGFAFFFDRDGSFYKGWGYVLILVFLSVIISLGLLNIWVRKRQNKIWIFAGVSLAVSIIQMLLFSYTVMTLFMILLGITVILLKRREFY